MRYTNPTQVTDVRITARPRIPTVTGYGRKIPTRYMIKYADRNGWRRVYVTQYGNAGSAWVTIAGERVNLDTWTEHWLIERDYERVTFRAEME